MNRHTITRATRGLLAATTLLTLAACGGGEDGQPEPDSTYVSWSGSANDVVILDWNNERFAVRRDNRNVAFYNTDTVLNNLTVNSSADVYWGSTRIGSVTYTTAVSGARIVDFTCLDGREMDITVTSGSWSYRCV